MQLILYQGDQPLRVFTTYISISDMYAKDKLNDIIASL